MKQNYLSYIGGVALLFVLLTGCQPSPPRSSSGLEPLRQEDVKGGNLEDTVAESAEVVTDSQELADVFEQLDLPDDFTAEEDALDPAFIAKRYQVYKDKEAKWAGLVKETATLGVGFEQPEQFVACYQLVHSLAGGYQALQSGETQGYYATSKCDIRFLSEGCDTVFGVQAIYLPTMLGVFKMEMAEQGREIVYYYNDKQDYEHIVLAVENLQDIAEGELSPELNQIYGFALVKMGRLDDAAKVLSLVVKGLDPREQWPLRLKIAELLIASGEYEEARNQYLAIAEVLSSWEETHRIVTDQLALLYATDDHTTEIALYTQCLYAYLSFDGHSIPVELEKNLRHLQLQYPGGIHTDAALRLYERAEDQTRNDVGLRLLRVQELADEKQFQQALDELQDMKQARLPDDAMARIDEMILVVREGRALFIQQEKERRVQALADRWQEGLNLLDMQMYDESIAVFSELLGTEYDGRAVKKIEKAASFAAVTLRKEAANLFIKARRTKDYNGRIAYLTQSRRLLQEILDKYPQVELAEKVAVNLAVIDEQLQAMSLSED